MSSPKKSKVIVALSGGVDSSVSAYLLKQAGYEVEGLFMKNWEEDDTENYCAAEEDVKDAKAVCDKLQIPFHTINFATEYWDNVFSYFLTEYKAGRTPNPDILCNREIKFKACMEYAKHLGADFFATGHYAQNINNDLYKAHDLNKDQTYFIYTLTQDLLKTILFPIGHLPKPEVRKIAESAGLLNYAKKDSTGICFIGERKFKEFLSKYLPAQPGTIESVDGNIMGKHDGLMYYTLGQRQGIKIGGLKTGSGEPWYVVDKDLTRNILLVAQGHEHPTLYSKVLDFEQAHWIIPQNFPLTCSAKTRYRQEDQVCTIERLSENKYKALFDQPQFAITPGQSVVFYQDNLCLGGGIIHARH
ncbi:MAG TPA: tRNA 2-thiouridine(34) synthase MnmA [Gammaproteobacteria bacterium]|nr:tRNA 2-thiouridine(34) synthase MnmA [Gammaproteobacteria bacterium]